MPRNQLLIIAMMITVHKQFIILVKRVVLTKLIILVKRCLTCSISVGNCKSDKGVCVCVHMIL